MERGKGRERESKGERKREREREITISIHCLTVITEFDIIIVVLWSNMLGEPKQL